MEDQTGAKATLNYLNAAELAVVLRQTKKWVQEYTRQGVIPAIKVGRQYFYSAEDVDAAFAALRPSGTTGLNAS